MRKLYLFVLLIFIVKVGSSQTVWTGNVITFTKGAGVSPTSAAGQDKITNNVWITRSNTEGLFNAASESDYTKTVSPAGTEWAYGELSNYNTLSYAPWETWNGKKPPSMVNKSAILHLIADNIYIGITFKSWGGSESGGTFSYERTTSSVLPVTLKSFSAALSNNTAVLQWKTSTEIQNSHFDIEHSVDGTNFSKVGSVEGNGSSTLERSYSFTHSGLATGQHYYRIAQQDVNGLVKYSQIILVSVNATGKLLVKPNPATSVISVTASSLLLGNEYTINAITGQVLLRGKISEQQINVQKLAAGQYWLMIKTNGGELLKAQFLKQ